MISDVLDLQAGVISRQQALDHGLKPHDIKRLLRRREWVRVHPGVFVDHTGELTWLQRAWAAVLWAEPAALCLDSAMRAADGAGRRDARDDEPIHVAISRTRSALKAPEGIHVHYASGLDDRVQWNRSPPRLRYEEAALDVACAAPDRLAAIAALAQACQSRRTSAARLLQSLADRERVPDRHWLKAVLQDVADGTNSVLEHGYLTLVERPHGLPRGSRQVRDRSGSRLVERDVVHTVTADTDLIVELDGRLFHDSTRQRDRDMDRDLDAAAAGRSTIRIGYGQVYERPCETAVRVVRVLWSLGWRGNPTPCGPGCPLAEITVPRSRSTR